jgi:NitT/TauT family transport system substrate-binding protein
MLAAFTVLAMLLVACGDGGDAGTAAGTPDTDTDTDTDTDEPGELVEITWISPRGSLEVMDDYNLWVPIEMGYFEELGLTVELIAGPQEATAPAKFVAEGQADVGYPSPGVLTASIDAGMPVRSIFGMMAGQTFNFAVPKGSDVSSPEDLEGKQISVADAGWQVIIDPMLIEIGIDPESVEYVEAGAQWGQAVSLGQVDAGLGWEGLRAQWAAQGLEVDWLVGQDWSEHPSNVYAVNAADLDDPERVDVWERFIKGMVMGFEFARANPQAAAQITYRQFPDLSASMEPQLALDSMMELGSLYGLSDKQGDGWGWHYEDGWSDYLSIIAELGQTSETLSPDAVFTNELLEAGNDIDLERVQRDAEAFELDEDFAATTPRTDVEL